MKAVTRFGFVCVAFGSGVLFVTHAADAQFQKAPAGAWTSQLQQQAPPQGPAAPQAQQVERAPLPIRRGVRNVTATRVRRSTEAIVPNAGLGNGLPVLNGFRFRFTESDHELRGIGVMPGTNSAVTLSFFDKNGDDPFDAEAAFTNLSGDGLARGSVIAAGEGQFDIPLPTNVTLRPPNSRLVLVGFNFWRVDDDHHVRMIGVWLQDARNVARVMLGDDSSKITDYNRRVGAPLGEAAIANADPAARGSGAVYPTVAAAEAAIRAMKAKKVGDPYGVQIQYGYIPTTIVQGPDGYYTGNGRSVPQEDPSRRFPNRAALVGFDFLFDNKDHHVKDIGVMPSLVNYDLTEQSEVRKKAPYREYVAFQDKNRDDPIKWAVKFVNFTPP
jgi:hypothetical protein